MASDSLLNVIQGLVKREDRIAKKEDKAAKEKLKLEKEKDQEDDEDEDYDPSALDKTRNFTHTLAIGWIYKRRKLYDHIQGALDKELEEGFNNEED